MPKKFPDTSFNFGFNAAGKKKKPPKAPSFLTQARPSKPGRKWGGKRGGGS